MDNNTGLQYFLATPADVSSLVDYRVEFFEEFWGKQDNAVTTKLREELAEYFTQSLEDNSYICWYAREGDTIVSIGGLVIRKQPGSFRNPSGRVGYLMSMYTIPAYRRRGISNNILNRLLTSAKDMGVTAFELHATKEGEQLYIKNGFSFHPEPTYRKYEL